MPTTAASLRLAPRHLKRSHHINIWVTEREVVNPKPRLPMCAGGRGHGACYPASSDDVNRSYCISTRSGPLLTRSERCWPPSSASVTRTAHPHWRTSPPGLDGTVAGTPPPTGPGQVSLRIWTPAKYQKRPVFEELADPLFPNSMFTRLAGVMPKSVIPPPGFVPA